MHPAAIRTCRTLCLSGSSRGQSTVNPPRLLVLRSFLNLELPDGEVWRGRVRLANEEVSAARIGVAQCSCESLLLRLAALGAGSANRQDSLLIMLHPSHGGSSSARDVPSFQLHFVQLQVCRIGSGLQLLSSDSPLFSPNRAVPCSHFTSLVYVPLLNLWCLFWDFWCDSLSWEALCSR